MKIENLLDQIQTLKNKRDLLVDTYEVKIEHLAKQLQVMMTKAGVSKAATGLATATIKTGVSKVTVTDWAAVDEFILKHDALDLLERRISEKAVLARLDANEVIKGVEVKKQDTFSMRKKSKKA